MSRLATELVVLREWQVMALRASGLGHRLGEPEQDTEVSLVGECLRCEELFAVDGQEPPHRFGRSIESRCTGVAILIA